MTLLGGDQEIERLLATPAIWTPNSEDEEIGVQIERMVIRSFATRDFLEGKITYDDLLCLLAEHDIDAAATDEGWQEGLVFL